MSGSPISRRRALGALAASGAGVLASLGRPTFAAATVPLTLAEAAKALRAGTLSPVELTRACLERIERFDRRVNAFITVTADQALIAARRAEAEIRKGRWRGPLHGIPLAVKDNVDTAGVPTTAACGAFADRVPAADADVVRSLKAAGAVLLGKLNMHECALGTTSAISHFGAVHNPWDLERIAGGSSGGSAAAVAAGFCLGAVGTDTGGSIRLPASACGIVGFKPTYGVVSTRGGIPVSDSFDHFGPMCGSVADAALMFRGMTNHPIAVECDPEKPSPVSGLRVGVVRTAVPICDRPMEAEVQAVFDAAVVVLRSLVAEIRDVELAMPDIQGVIEAECYRFHAPYITKAPERYDPRIRALILAGREISAEQEALGRQQLATHRASTPEAFKIADLVVLPTLSELPMRIKDATESFALSGCTFAFSEGGWPALSLPCGFSRSGLPIGMLIGGPALSEPRILALAQAYEAAAGWYRRRPDLASL